MSGGSIDWIASSNSAASDSIETDAFYFLLGLIFLKYRLIWGFQFLDGPLYSWNFCKEHLGTWTNKTGKLRDHLARVKHVEAKYVHSS